MSLRHMSQQAMRAVAVNTAANDREVIRGVDPPGHHNIGTGSFTYLYIYTYMCVYVNVSVYIRIIEFAC